MSKITSQITPFLWYNNDAEKAAKLYVSIFKNSRILEIHRHVASRKKGVLMVRFQIDGREFIAFNGGPGHKFTEAISMFITCKSQAEVDKYWKALTKGGKDICCGWVQDRFGLRWQIVPEFMVEVLKNREPEKSERAFQAMLKMKKLDIKALKRAYAGRK